MARRVCRGLPESYVQDAEQVARIAFAEGLQECPGTDEPLRFTWGRTRARQRLANWRKALHTQGRDLCRTASIDAPDATDRSLLDRLTAPSTHNFPADEAAAVDAAVDTLPLRSRVILRAHFWGDQPLPVIARGLGLSRMRVYQILKTALKILRLRLLAKGVRP
jgi:RNA polymerase sigma factor (sigma-70 family)